MLPTSHDDSKKQHRPSRSKVKHCTSSTQPQATCIIFPSNCYYCWTDVGGGGAGLMCDLLHANDSSSVPPRSKLHTLSRLSAVLEILSQIPWVHAVSVLIAANSCGGMLCQNTGQTQSSKSQGHIDACTQQLACVEAHNKLFSWYIPSIRAPTAQQIRYTLLLPATTTAPPSKAASLIAQAQLFWPAFCLQRLSPALPSPA